MRLISRIVIAAGALVLLSALLAAQQAAAPKEPKYTEVKYSADMSSYKWEGQDRILVLKGNVTFTHDDTVLTADKVDYRESTRTATATGNLTIKDDQNTITGNDCTVNFKEKKGTISGNVRMVAKPKPKPETTDSSKPKSLKSELKDEAVITCEKVEYYYKEKRAVVSTPLTITQKNRVVTADSAVYLGKEDTVQLVGNVKGRDEKDKHSFEAPKVTMSLKADNEWIEAEKASGSFYVKEEQPEEQPKPAEQPAETAAPRPGT